MTYLSAKDWPDNASLIAEVAEFWDFDQHVTHAIDLTYNTGKWWKQWHPPVLIANDLDRRYGRHHLDYRRTSEWRPFSGSFHLVAFDPPYCSTSRNKGTVTGMKGAYGMMTSAKSPAENQEWINQGLSTASLICAPRGVILVKVMDYISSGKLWLGVHHTLTHALTLPVEVEAIYTHVGRPGPQPTKNPDGTERRQVHPRSNASTLIVLRKNRQPKEKNTHA